MLWDIRNRPSPSGACWSIVLCVWGQVNHTLFVLKSGQPVCTEVVEEWGEANIMGSVNLLWTQPKAGHTVCCCLFSTLVYHRLTVPCWISAYVLGETECRLLLVAISSDILAMLGYCLRSWKLSFLAPIQNLGERDHLQMLGTSKWIMASIWPQEADELKGRIHPIPITSLKEELREWAVMRSCPPKGYMDLVWHRTFLCSECSWLGN